MSPIKMEISDTNESEVSNFYDGKSVLITGAAGYLGVVLLEILLRCCPGIHHIFIVLRVKKGMQPEERKEAIFKKEIFFSIKEKNPEYFKKVIVVSGDTSQVNLGISDNDFERVRQEVSIVFQCAASINFMKSLRFMLEQNFLSTNILIEFCRCLKKLDALVYTSSAYSNSNCKFIDEKIYKMPFTTAHMLETINTGSDEDLMLLYNKCEPKYVNYYTFTKCLSENLLLDKASDLPVSIIRPSIISSIWKGIIPGYIEGQSGIISLSLGIGKGFIRVMRIDSEKRMDYVPVDIVANAHVISSWLQATESLASPSIYNCVLGDAYLTWGSFIEEMLEMVKKYPLPNAYQKESVTVCKNLVKYWIYSIFEHYIPAIIIDMILRITGQKPRLFNLYRFYDKAMNAVQPFAMNDWDFRSENFKSLDSKLNAKDVEMFSVALEEYGNAEVTRTLPQGAPLYRWENDKKSFKERQRTVYIHYCFTSLIRWSIIGSLTVLLYALVF